MPAPLSALFMLTAVVILGASVVLGSPLAVLDADAIRTVHANTVAPLTHVVFGVTALGGTHVVTGVTIVAALVLALRRHWHGALGLVVAVLGTQLLVQAMKLFVARPRPDAAEALHTPSGFSFPSGHSATSVALYASLALLAARACRGGTRYAAAACGGILIVAIGLSRIYLGAHYPTDVLAGWLTGALVVVVAFWVMPRLGRPLRRSSAY